MEVINSCHDLFSLVDVLAKSSKAIKVASFGLWAGVFANGYSVAQKFNTRTYKTLGVLSKRNTRMIIGKPELICCEDGCKACEHKHMERVGRIKTTLDEFKIKHRIVSKNHAKFYLFDTGRYDVIVGGMNFTTSSWHDYMFRIQDKALYSRLSNDFNRWWK